jgi:hypothetical protein
MRATGRFTFPRRMFARVRQRGVLGFFNGSEYRMPLWIHSLKWLLWCWVWVTESWRDGRRNEEDAGTDGGGRAGCISHAWPPGPESFGLAVEVGLFPLHVAPWLPPSACYGQTIAMRFMCRGQIGLNREKIMNVFRNWKRKENEGKEEGISI